MSADNEFTAMGPAETGFQTNSTTINVGANITGHQVGIKGTCTGPGNGDGIQGKGNGTSSGVTGFGGSSGGTGVLGLGQGTIGHGVRGIGAGGLPIVSSKPVGVYGQGGTNGNGVQGISGNSIGAAGVHGTSQHTDGNGIIGEANNGSNAFGIWGISSSGMAGQFNGNVNVVGDLTINGTLKKAAGSFRIDHPLDPANKYLSHSFVESPDMLNIYNGNITTDANGDATAQLPDFFETLNQDFRYQLTVIGQFAQAIVAREINKNQFTIKTDKPHVKVSWQVTGIRNDLFAKKHRIQVEEDKQAGERGKFIHPEVHGKPETESIEFARGKQIEEP